MAVRSAILLSGNPTMKMRPTGIFHLLLWAFLILCESAAAQKLTYDEVSITVNVPRIGNTEVPALISEGELFLSAKDVFDFLKIKNAFTGNLDSLQGFISNPKDIFVIDGVNHTINYGNSATLLKPDELISNETGLYLKAPYFGKLFGLDCSFNFRNLSVVLSVKADLPFFREMQQELARKNLSRLKEEKTPDTTVGRKFSLLRLGMADWSVTATQEKNSGAYTRAGVALGGMMAGGELDLYTNYVSNHGFDPGQQYFKWRYVNNQNSALRQISIGRISTPVISTLQGPLAGIQLSNTPTTYRRSFGNYTISNTTQPGWIVELYVDNILVNYTRADASGFFSFEVPMVYGNSVVKLRFYGPSGEEGSQEQMVSVPFSFLPRHQFEYNVSAGRLVDQKNSRFSRASFNYGFSRVMTFGGGMEYLSSKQPSNPFPFVNASLRMGNNVIFSAEGASGVRVKGTLNYRSPRNLQLLLNYTKYQRGQTAVVTPYLEERSLVLSFPFKEKHFNSFTRFTYQYFFLPEGRSTNAELLISASANKINSNFTTRVVSYPASSQVYSELSISCRLPLNVRFTPLIQYDYAGGRFSRIKTEFEKTFSNNGAINLYYEKNVRTAGPVFGLGIRLNLSGLSSAFSALRSGHTTTFVQSAGGSLIYDRKTGYKSFNRNFSVGRAAVSVVAFLDLNNNGVRDPKEPVAPGLKFSINGGRVSQEEQGRITRVLDLEAYRTYILQVDPRSFDNLSWRGKNKTIAVETEPNHVRLVEVPVSVVSEASGYVYIRTPAGLKGLSRMIVRFYAGDRLAIGSTLTEQDGFFSFIGLTPGSYVAALDSAQLHVLNFQGEPASISFTIANTEEGVIADGFQFTVISQKKEENEVKESNQLQVQPSQTGNGEAQKNPPSNLAGGQTKSTNDLLQNKNITLPQLKKESKTGLPGLNKQIQKHGPSTKPGVKMKPTEKHIAGKPQSLIKEKTNPIKTEMLMRNKNGWDSLAAQNKTNYFEPKEAVKTSGLRTLDSARTSGEKTKDAEVKTKKRAQASLKQADLKKLHKPKKKTAPRSGDQKKKTRSSAEDRRELIEQLQRLLKKRESRKAEMAFVLFSDTWNSKLPLSRRTNGQKAESDSPSNLL